MTTEPLVIYHADCADGFGAAFAAWWCMGDNAEYVPAHYGSCVISNGTIDINGKVYDLWGRRVALLDFSLPPSEMYLLLKEASFVIWLDHHKTAMDSWLGPDFLASGQTRHHTTMICPNGVNVPCNIILDNELSGAQIAWDYYNPNQPRPRLIDHIADRDLWKWKMPGTKEISQALRIYPQTFESWQNFIEDPVSCEVLEMQGSVLLLAQQERVRHIAESDLRLVTVGGRQMPSANVCNDISEVGHALSDLPFQCSLTFFIKGNEVICSLRGNGEVDVSAIAKSYGGGGHYSAAGFHMPIQQFFSEIWK